MKTLNNMENGKQSAFPEIKTRQGNKDNMNTGNAYGDTFSEGGLTKREYFAAMAMQGMLAKSSQCVSRDPDVNKESMEDCKQKRRDWIKDVADSSVIFADALLKALEE